MITLSPEAEERFWAKVDRTGDCWEWTASKSNGYGRFGVPRQGKNHVPQLAHRIAYELLVGPIPEGLGLDHLCRNRGCVNPAHLEPVTSRTNLLRGETITAAHAAKTHCLRGHPFDAVNTYHKRGERHCRACRKAQYREWALANRISKNTAA